MPSEHVTRMISNETGAQNSRLFNALRHLIDEELVTSTEAIAVARAVRLAQKQRDDIDTQRFVGSMFINELDDLSRERGRRTS